MSRARTRVAAQVIRSALNYHHGGLEVERVLTKPYQHLRRGLACDAAVEIGLAGEELRLALAPPLSDFVADKHDTAALRAKFGVLAAIADEAGPVREPANVARDFFFQLRDRRFLSLNGDSQRKGEEQRYRGKRMRHFAAYGRMPKQYTVPSKVLM